MRDRRSKLEIYHDILGGIILDSQDNQKISPTRIQFKSNLSYDKLKQFVSDMSQKNILVDSIDMKITESGMKFYNEYSEIRAMIQNLCDKVFKED